MFGMNHTAERVAEAAFRAKWNQEQGVAMAEPRSVETTEIGDQIARFQPAPVGGKTATAFFGAGKDLATLLIKAAGLEGKGVRSLTCRVSMHQAVTFEVEMLGREEAIADALQTTNSTAAATEAADTDRPSQAGDEERAVRQAVEGRSEATQG